MAVHSLGVCKKALSRRNSLPRESVIICSLLHDVCDIRGFEHIVSAHGGRSVNILEELGMDLTDGERCAIRNHMRRDNHPNPKKRISASWDSVMSIPDNKMLQELIYHWDKKDANHDNPFPEMVAVPGMSFPIQYQDDYSGLMTEYAKVSTFKISKHLITWGFWRFVMGDRREKEPISDCPEDMIDKRNRAPLVGAIEQPLKKEFLGRLKDMTGLNFSFPTYSQRQLALKNGLLRDTHDYYEILHHNDGSIIADNKETGYAICQQCGLEWEKMGYRLVITL